MKTQNTTVKLAFTPKSGTLKLYSGNVVFNESDYTVKDNIVKLNKKL